MLVAAPTSPRRSMRSSRIWHAARTVGYSADTFLLFWSIFPTSSLDMPSMDRSTTSIVSDGSICTFR